MHSDPQRSAAASPLPDTVDVAIIGGGIAGLIAARDCARIGASVVIFEKSDVAGGQLQAQSVAGIQFDSGADSFLGTGESSGSTIMALIRELALEDELVTPKPARPWLYIDQQAMPQPVDSLVGIPASPLATDVVRVLGWRGALRAYGDRLRPVLTIGREQNLGNLVCKRMGARALERLVAPVAHSRYGVSPHELDISIVAPGLNAAITRLGSLSGAVTELLTGHGAANRSRASASGVSSTTAVGMIGGMSRIIEALTDNIGFLGGRIESACEVTAVIGIEPDRTTADTRGAGGAGGATGTTGRPGAATATEIAGDTRRWRVECADGRQIIAGAVVLATDQEPALRLLASDGRRETWEWPQSAVRDEVTLVIDAPELDRAPRGTEVYIAQSGVQGASGHLIHLTHLTAKWEWLANAARSPEHPSRHILRLTYGAVNADVAASDPATSGMSDETLARALADVSSVFGVQLERSGVAGANHVRVATAVPRGVIGQRERVESLREIIAARDGIEVVGAWVAGTDLAAVTDDARDAARRIRSLLVHDGFHNWSGRGER